MLDDDIVPPNKVKVALAFTFGDGFGKCLDACVAKHQFAKGALL